MSATTTTTPAKVATPQESDAEIMKEWDGVVHFDDSDEEGKDGKVFIALCGEEVICAGSFEAEDDTLANECPICRSLFNARKP